MEGHRIKCPHHGACFDVRTGDALSLPAIAPVESYPVVIEGDDVFVELDDSFSA
jgi:nitrite reductase/ring-hydroxylating ferredoxin subunit